MGEPMRARIELLHAELERLLQAAAQAGALAPCDPPRLAHALLSAVAGSLLLALMTQSADSVEAALDATIDTTLAPYLLPRPRTHE